MYSSRHCKMIYSHYLGFIIDPNNNDQLPFDLSSTGRKYTAPTSQRLLFAESLSGLNFLTTALYNYKDHIH